MLRLFNTRSREVETFIPRSGRDVGFYACGPTVYNYAHIGNLRTYIFEDILRRTLEIDGFAVKHVMNITDVGHLTDDADAGEDKMEKGARREGKTAWEIAEFYTEAFKHDIADLNIKEPHIWCKATDHIQEQIDQVQQLMDAGHTYETNDGIYFDTTSIDDYGKLAQLDKQELQAGARVEMGEKKHPNDFALWKFSKEGEQRQMEWEAFDHKGFPGWHIECSAMSMKYLGDQFDIHAGGIDHVSVHHTNEIAQAESVTGKKPWVSYWMHGEFLNVSGEKMAKSDENFLTVQVLKDRNIDPLAYRYFVLQAHYRKQLTFSWEALGAAANGLDNLRSQVARIPDHAPGDPSVYQNFLAAINDDLNTAEALAILWKGIKDGIVDKDMVASCDKILGLKLLHPESPQTVPAGIKELLEEREEARAQKDWEASDKIRDQIAEKGFTVEDTDEGQRIIPV